MPTIIYFELGVTNVMPYERLEPYEGKLSRTVLRGGIGSNVNSLPDQMLERKQSFISQIMTTKSPQRRCDDIDEATLSYAEVKALCVGDPRIKEKMELDNEIGRLALERSSYQQEQYRLEDSVEQITKQIAVLKSNIPKNQNRPPAAQTPDKQRGCRHS